jgi:M6 family metalloprotease-like protein
MHSAAKSRIVVLMGLLFLVFCAQAMAVCLHPDVVEKLRAEGSLENVIQQLEDARARGVDAPSETPLFKSISLGSGPDTIRAVVLLTEFTDNLAEDGLVYADSAYFDMILNSEGIMEYGSMREYYLENSGGQLVFIADVYGWFMMPETYAYYVFGMAGQGRYPNNSQKLVEDACFLADPYVDFSLYDNDNDSLHLVDALIVVHAGPGREVSGDMNMIHSHAWVVDMTEVDYYDGVHIFMYNMDPEENSITEPEPIAIGVFCHEFGHTLGLPDLYDIDYTSRGVGYWSLMASGAYNGNSKCPAHLDAWCKKELGWLNIENIEDNVIGHEFPQVETSGYAARLWKNGSIGSEYFLIENRQKAGFDSHLPGEGLLIWHINENIPSNQIEYSYKVALEQADGLFEMEENINRGDAGDPYPGTTNNREFSETTIPSSYMKVGLSSRTAVWNISDCDDTMYANLDINYTRPRFELVDYYLEELCGDGDEYPDGGETWGLYLQIINQRADTDSVMLYAAMDTDSIILDETENFMGSLDTDELLNNSSSPLTFTIDANLESSIATLEFMIADAARTDSVTVEYKFNIGPPQILFVDHDADYEGRFDLYYSDVFDYLKVPYQRYARDSMGTPGSEYLVYPMIVWFTSWGTLESPDVAFLTDYLGAGGKLFLTGQNIAEGLASGPDSLFLKDYLKCSYDFSGNNYFTLSGVDGSEIGADSIKLLIADEDGAMNQNSMDVLTDIDPSATPCLVYKYGSEFPGYAGLEYRDSDYSIVFWGFGFEAINSAIPADYNTRIEAMRRVLAFLDNIATGVEDETDDQVLPLDFTLDQNYPNPFNLATTISFSIPVSGQVSLDVYNLLGQKVVNLVEGEYPAGKVSINWDGKDRSGNDLAAGVYFYRMSYDGAKIQSRKLMILK